MRIASNQFQATMNRALQDANAGLSQVMQQMASGAKLLTPSDDPIATLRLSRLSSDDAAITQYQSNITALQSRLSNSEAVLNSVSQNMNAARDLLVWAADGSNTPSDLNAMSGSLRSLHDSLLYLANSTDAEGHYLFSGTASNQPTVDAAYAFQGNTATQEVAVADRLTLSANVSLPTIGGFLKQLDALATLLATPGITTAGVQGNVSAMITGLDGALDTVSSTIGVLGGRQNMLKTLSDTNAAVKVSNQQSELSLGQLDYGEASTRLSSYSIAVQATQKAYAKVSQLSLFSVI
ncbi:flagellar hook-associated protein FlgL [Roseateles sp. BYS78W]|uniref:Flagellar hook-associated protein FlgL n=1 Tax=Pelomonas candidula TaxID=3299025 RepID=A0ABW7HGC4_9BURK